MKKLLTYSCVEEYENYLETEERSKTTQKQYKREAGRFLMYLSGRKVTKELTKAEYIRLLTAAKKQGEEKMWLILQTICGTGIRISELPFITAEAVREGEVTVNLKGKTRTLLLGGKLRQNLRKYMSARHINSGPIFITRTGKPIDRSNIWRKMKKLCETASVKPTKVFPHNLRHLFARTFYKESGDIVRLADVLGHSNINTTRIYIISTGSEHRRYIDAMGLVC